MKCQLLSPQLSLFRTACIHTLQLLLELYESFIFGLAATPNDSFPLYSVGAARDPRNIVQNLANRT